MRKDPKNAIKKPGGELSRAEWDFSGCPQGREDYCFNYEYARECPWITGEYLLARRYPRRARCQGDRGFDEFWNWHFAACGDSELHDDWGIVLQIPLGFPDHPYLSIKHEPHKLPPPIPGGGLIDLDPPFGEKQNMLKAGVPPFALEAGGYNIFINWGYPDKRLVQDFAAWLKQARERPPWEVRGRSRAREMLTDLKALGAYRLLKTMTAEQALAYTKRVVQHGLYVKLPDWYEAKRRALDVLADRFRFANPDDATSYLEQLDRTPRKQRGHDLELSGSGNVTIAVRILPEGAKLHDATEVASFGEAHLLRYFNGKYELRGGSEADRAAAREWCSLLVPTAVSACPPAPPRPGPPKL